MVKNIYYLVRHAEKKDPADPDTPISTAGKKRAIALKETLKKKSITNIIVSEFIRTQQTAKPLSVALGVPHTMMSHDDITNIIKRFKNFPHSLLVGHTDNIPAVIKKITGKVVTIPENDFDNMFIITVSSVAGVIKKKLTRTTYGLPSP